MKPKPNRSNDFIIKELTKTLNYWRARCLAAEKVIENAYISSVYRKDVEDYEAKKNKKF